MEQQYPFISIEEEAKHYFDPRDQEDSPLTLDESTNIRYYNLEMLFNTFYPSNSLTIAKQKSKEEREQKHLTDPCFTYGEITFRTFSYIYEYIKRQIGRKINRGIFYDCGSGTGKATIAMSLFHPFVKLVGVEFLDSLYTLSSYTKKAYDISIKDKFEKFKGLFTISEINLIEFYCGDFLRQRWADPSIIFINSTCFDNNEMVAIGNKANRECRNIGIVLVTISKRIKNLDDTWETKEGFKRLMSWGLATIYIHVKVKE